MARMTRIQENQARLPALTPEERAEEEDLARLCHAAAVRLFQMLDREETEAGGAADYGPAARRQRPVRKTSARSARSVVKKGAGS